VLESKPTAWLASTNRGGVLVGKTKTRYYINMKNTRGGVVNSIVMIFIMIVIVILGGIYFYIQNKSELENTSVVRRSSAQKKQSSNQISTSRGGVVSSYTEGNDIEGVYDFEESNTSGSGSNQTWRYRLAVTGDTGIVRMTLEVDGFDTLTTINASANKTDDIMDVVFESYGNGNSFYNTFSQGDILFRLYRIGAGFGIEWKKMKPQVETSKTGAIFSRILN
jgi:hypothetical protein